MIAILDYGLGNTRSIYNAFHFLQENVLITDDPKILRSSDAIVVPGVGSFNDGMNNLKKKNLLEILNEEVIEKQKPYLGICLGMEFLAEKSFENGEHSGFGWIKGNVIKLENQNLETKIPHVGFDDTEIIKNSLLLSKLEQPIFYYLHSYFLNLENSETNFITSICNYGGNKIIGSFEKNNIHAVQFHPEKSQGTGLKLLQNFLSFTRK